jgi:hypothetical protein
VADYRDLLKKRVGWPEPLPDTGKSWGVVDTITDGDTTHAPTGNAVHDALDLKVPYTGATGNVDIGANSLTGGEITLTPKSTSTSTAEGTIFYCSDDNYVYVGTE